MNNSRDGRSDELERLVDASRRVGAAVDRVRGRAHSPDGAVRIEVGVDGSITSLHIGSAALGAGAAALAGLVMRLHAEARVGAEAAAAPLRAELLADPAVAGVFERIGGAGGPSPEADDDGYFSGFSVFGADR